MRPAGVLDTPTSAPGGHVCWVFNDDHPFGPVAASFLADGLVRGERLLVVGDASTEAELLRWMAPLGDPARLLDDGVLEVHLAEDLYTPDQRLDTARQVATYESMTRQAIADGFTGLRVAADATVLAEHADQRQAFIRYEHAVDALMAAAPMTALCGYDAGVLGHAAAELACVHPQHHLAPETAPGFSLYHAEHDLRLDGEIDHVNRDLLSMALEVAVAAAAHDVSIDLAGLSFIDGGGMGVLLQVGRSLASDGRHLRLVHAPELVRRCWSVLGFDGADVVDWADA